MTFADHVIQYHRQLQPDWRLPKGFELIYPFDNDDTWSCFERFYKKYFSTKKRRTVLFGINPGRFGAGITGVAFTDPKIMAEDLNISNPFQKRNELSSVFVYEMIDAMGGAKKFYRDFYITSVCPLGFIKDGKNINYYDDPKLEKAVLKKITEHIQAQFDFGINLDVAYSMGQGKNYKFLKKLNEQHHFFKEVIPLPHPRWVLQYRRKSKDLYTDEYVLKLNAVLGK